MDANKAPIQFNSLNIDTNKLVVSIIQLNSFNIDTDGLPVSITIKIPSIPLNLK